MSAHTPTGHLGHQTSTGMQCPVCAEKVIAHTDGIGQCRTNGHWVTLEDARQAAALAAEVAAAQEVWHRYADLSYSAQLEVQRRERVTQAALESWQASVQDTERAEHVAQRYAELSQQAREYLEYQEGVLQQLRHEASAPFAPLVAASPAGAQGGQAPQVRPAPVVAAPASPPTAPPPMTPAADQPRRRLPTAVILQGTGALMILAATVLAFGIAWTILPPAGQSTLMILIVLVLGGITIGLRHKLPTTSLILAVLTAAVAVAVAAFLPFVAGFTSRWYPALAATGVTALLAVTGRYAGVLVWRHLSWAGAVVSLVIWASTLFGELSGANGAALSTLLWAGGAVALLHASVRMRRSDVETATTAYWSGLTLAGFTVLAAIGMLLVLAAEPGSAPRLLPAAALAALVPVLTFVLPRDKRPYAFLPAALTIDVLITPVVLDAPLPALVLPALVALQLAFGVWGLRRGVPEAQGYAWVAVVIGSALVTLLLLVPAAAADELSMLWLTLVALAIVVGAAMVLRGWQAGSPLLAYAGVMVASAAWLATYIDGHLPQNVEFFTVPVLGAVVGTQFLMRPRSWPLPAVFAAVVLALPSYLVAISEWGNFERVSWANWMWWVVILAAPLGLGWSRPPSRTVVAIEAVLGALLFAFVTAANNGVDVPEAYIAMASVGLFAGLAVAHADGYINSKFTPALVGAGFMLTGAYLVALFAAPDVVESWWRRGVVLVVLAGVAVGLRRVAGLPAVWWSVGAAWAGLVLAGVWWGQWLAGNGWTEALEVWSVPLAVLATVGVWVTWQVAGWPRWSLVVPAGAAFAASMVAAVLQPLGVANTTGTIRVLLVLAALWTAVALLWTRPKWCLGAGALALAFTWWQFAFAMANNSRELPFEVYTWSAAVAVAAATWLALRLPHAPLNTAITMAPTMTLVFLPTAAMAWWDPDSGWRLWFVVFIGGAFLALGVMKGWAGMLWPSLAAIALALFPILTLLVSYMPVFIPLTIMGVLLILTGARIEKFRLQGRHLAHWATHLH